MSGQLVSFKGCVYINRFVEFTWKLEMCLTPGTVDWLASAALL